MFLVFLTPVYAPESLGIFTFVSVNLQVLVLTAFLQLMTKQSLLLSLLHLTGLIFVQMILTSVWIRHEVDANLVLDILIVLTVSIIAVIVAVIYHRHSIIMKDQESNLKSQQVAAKHQKELDEIV